MDAGGFAAAVLELRRGRLHGINVTMPHKLLAAEACDELTAVAARAGSVNTLWMSDGKLWGDSTDVAGIRAAWEPLPLGPALVLGSGGAAAAALLALEGRPLRVAARRRDRAAELVDRTEVDALVIDWDGLGANGEVVVNATPLGMHGEQLPAGVLDGATGLFEMPYGAGETPAVRTARAAGLPVVDGTEMLLHQAAASFRLWTASDPSLEAMREVLRSDHSPGSNR